MTEIRSVTLQKNSYLVAMADGTSVLVPRLTGVLNILNKPGLMWWAANAEREWCIEAACKAYGVAQSPSLQLGPRGFRDELIAHLGDKKAHQQQSKKAKDIGSETHDLIQHELKGQLGVFEPVPASSDEAAVAFMAWQDWATAIGFKPRLAEKSVASVRLLTGGTVDAAGYERSAPGSLVGLHNQLLAPALNEHALRGRYLVCDWKSNKRSQTAPNGIYYENRVQISVYRRMGIEMGLFPEDAQGCIVRLPKNIDDPVIQQKQPVDVEYIDPEQCESYVEDFARMRELWARLAMRGQT